MTDDKSPLQRLRDPFPAEVIGKLPKGGGVQLDYVGHAAVTDRLLTTDAGWTWEPVSIDPATGTPLLDREGNLWIRLTICGVTRYGVGDGATMKIRVGDALRNAAMRFGVALELWTRDELESTVSVNSNPQVQSFTPERRVESARERKVESPPEGLVEGSSDVALLRTDEQSKRLWTLAGKVFPGPNKEAIAVALRAWLSHGLKREITSTTTLTRLEAADAITHLSALAAEDRR